MIEVILIVMLIALMMGKLNISVLVKKKTCDNFIMFDLVSDGRVVYEDSVQFGL